LDKLESIPGFDPRPSADTVVRNLKKAGAVIMGQTEDLAPADRRIYALRDVTATVESIPLITASILSKKLAEDIDGLVLDVKAGSGAFMPTIADASALARSIVSVCRKMKTGIVAIITDMDQPLGRTIGNALEIRECIEFLNGKAPEDLETVSLTLAAYMIYLGKAARTLDSAYKMAYEAVSKGSALERFREMIRLQGGNERVLEDTHLLAHANNVQEFRARSDGFVTRCDARLLGLASNALGAGRYRLEDAVDPAVGLHLHKKLGDRVRRGDVLCEIHWNHTNRFHDALPLVEKAFGFNARPGNRRPLIHAVLQG
jgi:pyrimidine-nucleoside phosphorylase